ncbi:hypothetical protein AB0O31_10070 [Kitasatospora cineracea]|uniref:hypothetical protein n=1 Tax=Kitasatospora cineracea TaxID=88074 RepID=UPI003421E5FB
MSVTVSDNNSSSIIVAAGPVTMHRKPLLPVTDVPEAELDAVRSAAWVGFGSRGEPVTVADSAAARLAADGPGLAVIVGPPGYGKRAAALRALLTAARAEENEGRGKPEVKEIRADWKDPVAPDLDMLPDASGTGYLLDVASEIGSWTNTDKVAIGLVGHAEKLRRTGSFLVVVADAQSWPADGSGALGRVVAPATVRPSAHRVARAHLQHLYRRPELTGWLDPQPDPPGKAGGGADLLTGSSSPADAVRLAGILSVVEASPEGLRVARETFQEWGDQIKEVFAATQDRPDDRALLIAALFLPGQEAPIVQAASRELLKEPAKTNVREILTGPDLTTRLEQVKAKVEGRCVTFDHRPGYAQAVLRHLWRQRPDLHVPLLGWIGGLTRPKQPGAALLAPIGDLLADLAAAENDIRVIEEIRNWIDTEAMGTEHLELIAGVLARTAQADGLGPAVRRKLLRWAQEGDEAVARTVALVCRTSFSDNYPQQALVRLRHVLGRAARDQAVSAAEEALREFAARDDQLGRVWRVVSGWATGRPDDLAGHRAFLALVDPCAGTRTLRILLEAGGSDREVKQALIEAWSMTLVDGQVHEEAKAVLVGWAHAFADDAGIRRQVLTDILREVVARHVMTTPISALVYGEPGVRYDRAVIELRKELAFPAGDVFAALEPER